MNCKQGDVAIIISGAHLLAPGVWCDCTIGAVVQLTRRWDTRSTTPGWRFNEPLVCKHDMMEDIRGADDCTLRSVSGLPAWQADERPMSLTEAINRIKIAQHD